MVPTVELPPFTPATLHVTAELNAPVPATVAVHCEVWPACTDVEVQAAVTEVMVGEAAGVGVGVDVEPPLLHPVRATNVVNPDKLIARMEKLRVFQLKRNSCVRARMEASLNGIAWS
jgi:hypothetical protein